MIGYIKLIVHGDIFVNILIKKGNYSMNIIDILYWI